MARIAHLSDVHFGAHDDKLVAAVEARLIEEKPDLVVVSGDFTQRAREEQFRQAGAFIERLHAGGLEVLGVPGNHDIPLYDVLRRFLSPLTRYKRHIDDELCPFIELDGVAVLGINTARSLTFKDGRINRDQVAHIRESFSDVDRAKPRVLVTHHPMFQLPVDEAGTLGKAIGRQEMALEVIEEMGVDILLAGHNHRASTGLASEMVTKADGTLVVQAGTATSIRLREQDQNFNLIDIKPEDVTITVETWQGGAYAPGDAQRYIREDERKWRRHEGVTAGASEETEAVS